VKVTNLSTLRLYLDDLKVTHESQVEGRQGENRYLGPGQSVYLPNTSEVLRSVYKGDLRKWRDIGVVELEDTDTLAANGDVGDAVTLTHNFGIAPVVYILKQVGNTWVDATGTVDVVHNQTFTAVTITNTIASPQTLFIRLV
jgi:hypothetical protein